MRFGYCASIPEAPLLRELGYDYVEGMLRELEYESQQQLREERALLESAGIRAEVFNCFYGEQRVVGPEAAPLPELLSYANRVLERAAGLGCRVAVYGSGRARNIPAAFPREKAWGQLQETLGRTAEAAKQFGITLVLEPLDTAETNLINSVEEGGRMVRELAQDNLFLMADWYHVCRVGEPFDHIAGAGSLLRHIHLADAVGRHAPAPGDGTDYAAMALALRQAGYGERISIEAVGDPARTARQAAADALAVLRRYFNQEA